MKNYVMIVTTFGDQQFVYKNKAKNIDNSIEKFEQTILNNWQGEYPGYENPHIEDIEIYEYTDFQSLDTRKYQ